MGCFLYYFYMYSLICLSTIEALTFVLKSSSTFILKLNTLIAPERGALPMKQLKGIITLTIVISRESGSSTVKRGAFVMFHFFKIKTKLEYRVDEYLQFKAKTSPFVAEYQKLILLGFIKNMNCTNISQITIEDLKSYYEKITKETTPFNSIRIMQAIRAFFRFHKSETTIKPYQITNQGIHLLNVGNFTKVIPMQRPKVGRPINIELVKKVKSLRDSEHLSFRAIGRATNKDVKNIYLMYNYDISGLNVGKKVIHS